MMLKPFGTYSSVELLLSNKITEFLTASSLAVLGPDFVYTDFGLTFCSIKL